MVVAGTEDAVLMVESEADELTEDQMLGAVLFAHDEFQAVIRAVKELAAEAGKPAWDWKAPAENTVLVNAIKAELGEAISQAYTITIKQDRYNRLGELRDQAVALFAGEEGQVPGFRGQGRIRPAGIPHRSREHRQRQAAYRRS